MAMSQLVLEKRSDAYTDQDFEGIVNKILEELNELGDGLSDKWINIAKSLEIDIQQTSDDEEHNSRKIITLLVKKSLGLHMWPLLLKAIEKEMPGSYVLKHLKEKYNVSHSTSDSPSEESKTLLTRKVLLQHLLGRSELKFYLHIHVVILAVFLFLIFSAGTCEWKDPIEEQLANNPVSAEQWQEVSARTVRILVTGKTGTGKSTLINALFGEKVAEEGHSKNRETTEVKEHRRLANGIPLIILDSPGLQDGLKHEEEYMEDMVNKCKELDLVLYTMRMDDKRISEDDKRAMMQITSGFGVEFWNKTMIVLTFANNIKDPRIDPGLVDRKKDEDFLNTELQTWQNDLPKVLRKLNISSDIVDRIPIVPAGYYKVRDLPGRQYWFGQFWMSALNRMKESGPNSHLLLHFSKDRFKRTQESTAEDFEKEIHEQPIFYKVQTAVSILYRIFWRN